MIAHCIKMKRRVRMTVILATLSVWGFFCLIYYSHVFGSSSKFEYRVSNENNSICSMLKEKNPKLILCDGSIPKIERDVQSIHIESVFKAKLTQSEYEAQMGMIQQIQTVCETNGIVYFFYGGSLIGSYRNFGMVPWDDDIDILLHVTDKQKFRDSVLGSNEYTLVEFKDNLWKYFKTNRSEFLENNKNYMWPFIDILFYTDNGRTLTLLWDTVDPLPEFNKNDVFPLSYMPFDTFVVPVPKKPEIVLKKVHGDFSLCVSAVWSHQHEEKLNTIGKVPCSDLYSIYPFVQRTEQNGRIREELRIGNVTHMIIERFSAGLGLKSRLQNWIERFSHLM